MLDDVDLDEVMPDYDFSERHRRRVHASPDDVWDALTTLTLADLTLTRPFVALRHPGRRPAAGPLLSEGPLQLLDVVAGRHAVGGAVARPWQRDAPRREVGSVAELVADQTPGWTKYLTTFVVHPTADGCVLSTETRGTSTDRHARRRFALYWAVIRIPSGIIRRDVLRSVARRAEGRTVARRAERRAVEHA